MKIDRAGFPFNYWILTNKLHNKSDRFNSLTDHRYYSNIIK